MTYSTIILLMAKTVGVPGALLLAICSHESNGFKDQFVANDKGTPSYGVCMVKEDTAKMFGYTGKSEGLMNAKLNAKLAAKYLKYQLDRYDNNWCMAAAAYNAGTFFESRRHPGKPKNFKYVSHVKRHIEAEDLKRKLDCEAEIFAEKEIGNK